MIEEDNVYCKVKEKGKLGFFSGRTVFLWGDGKLFKTNKRVVIIREPMEKVGYFNYTGGYPIVISTTMRRKESDKANKNIRQYLQFRIDEILNWKKGLFNDYKIYLKDQNNGKYVATIKLEHGTLRL